MTQITKEAIEALESARAHILEAYRIWQADDVSAVPPPKSGAGAVIAKIDAVLSSPIAGEVAALEWDECTQARSEADPNREVVGYEAGSPVGIFYGIRIEYDGFHASSENDHLGRFDDLDAAKAAAQADYDTRILSALISSPGKDGGQEVEPAEWQRFVDGFGWQKVNEVDLAHYRDKGALLRPLYTAPPTATDAIRRAAEVITEAEKQGYVTFGEIKSRILALDTQTASTAQEVEAVSLEEWVRSVTAEQLKAANAGLVEMLEDKIEGLQADLDSAVEVAHRRGATEWTRLNYPDHFKRLADAQPASTALVERLVKALEPFAKRAARWDDIPGIYRCHDNVELWQNGNWRCDLTVGDLREARSAIAAAKGESTDANS